MEKLKLSWKWVFSLYFYMHVMASFYVLNATEQFNNFIKWVPKLEHTVSLQNKLFFMIQRR